MDARNKATIGAALSRIASGCFVLTVRDGDRSTGMLASWVQQAGFDPPAVTVCVKKGRPAEEWVDGSGHFLLNVLGENPSRFFRHFAKGFEPGDDAFAGLAIEERSCGVLLSDCPAHLECRVIDKFDAGDHWLYLGEVLDGAARNGAPPYVHIRKNGFNY